MQVQVADFIDALEYESAKKRYEEASLLIIGPDRKFEPGTDEYNRLARMRLQAKKEIMGVSTPRMFQGFSGESYQHNQSEYRNAMR